MPVTKIIKRDDDLGFGYGPSWAGIKVDTTDLTLQYNPNGTARTVVTTALTQTLTNKTLTSPTITGPTISGTTTLSGTVNTTAAITATGTSVWQNTYTNASATPGTVRGIIGQMNTAVATLTSGNLVGARGCVTCANSSTIGAGSQGPYLYGVQGKIIGGTATINIGSGMAYAVMGQLDVSGTTVTGGYVAAVGADIFGVSSGLKAVDMFYGQHADGGTINSYLRCYGKATYFFQFDTNGGAHLATSAGSAASKYLTLRIDGTT